MLLRSNETENMKICMKRQMLMAKEVIPFGYSWLPDIAWYLERGFSQHSAIMCRFGHIQRYEEIFTNQEEREQRQ